MTVQTSFPGPAGTAVLYGTLPFDAGVPTTPDRLTGAPVLLAHGQDDRVIPPDLQQATWAYLETASGAEVRAIRSPGGHAISPTTLTAFQDWVSDVTTPQRAAS